MIKYIILTVVCTIIVMLLFFIFISAVYEAGRDVGRKEFKEKMDNLEALSREYQDQLAQVRAERKLMKKKGGD